MKDAEVSPKAPPSGVTHGCSHADLVALIGKLPRLIYLSPSPQEAPELAQNEGCDI